MQKQLSISTDNKAKTQKLDKPKGAIHPVVFINEMGPALSVDERTKFVGQFDMIKFEERVRVLIQEFLKPVVKDQASIFEGQKQQNKDQMLMSHKVNDSAQQTHRMFEAMAEFSKLDKEMISVQKQCLDNKETINNNMDTVASKLRDVFKEMHTISQENEKLRSDVKIASKNTSIDMPRLIAIITQHKQQLEDMFQEQSQINSMRVSELESSQKELKAKLTNAVELMGNQRKQMKDVDKNVAKMTEEVKKTFRQQDQLKDVFTYNKRIEFLENEVRQLRMLQQQQMQDQEHAMSFAVTRRETEEIILKWNTNMLDHIFGKSLKDPVKVNIDTHSQIKINMNDWLMEIKKKYDKGDEIFEEQLRKLHVTFKQKLPKFGKFRTAKLKAQLDATKIFDDVKKKDHLGHKRRLSFDNVADALWSKPKKTLEEKILIKDEFIADKPDKYKPKYKTKKRRIKFIEPAPPKRIPTPKQQDQAIVAGLRKKSGQNPEQQLDQNEQIKKNNDQLKELEGENRDVEDKYHGYDSMKELDREKKNLAFQKDYEMRKYKAQVKYEQELAYEEERVKYEWWRNQRVPLHLGVVEKNKNIKREHSNHKFGNKVLISGDTFKPVVIFHKHKYRKMIDQRSNYINSETASNGPKADLAKIQSMKELKKEMEKNASTKSIVQQPRKRKMPKNEEADQYTQWGQEKMHQTPHAAKGMQFVNIDALVDMNDLENFKKDFVTKVEQDIDTRFIDVDNKIAADALSLVQSVESQIKSFKVEMRKETEISIKENAQTIQDQADAQDIKISEQTKFLDEQMYLIKFELARKFIDQHSFNDSVNHRFKYMSKKMHMQSLNIQADLNKCKELVKSQGDSANYVENNQKQVLKLLISLVETAYIESLLQYQDEFDRHSMSLFGINERNKPSNEERVKSELQDMVYIDTLGTKETDGKNGPTEVKKKKVSMFDQQYLKVDEDCLACSLDKYRPTIKEAFKMACVEYKPSGVPFRGNNYLRKSMIEIKDNLLMDTWLAAINEISFLRDHFNAEISYEPEMSKVKFLQSLDNKIRRIYKDHDLAKDKYVGQVNELQIERGLHEQIIKNPSNMGLLFDRANDDSGLMIFKKDSQASIQQLNTDINVGEQSLNDLKKLSKNASSLKRIDRKTQSIIDRLKDQTRRKSSLAGAQEDYNESQGYQSKNWRHNSQGDISDGIKVSKIERKSRMLQNKLPTERLSEFDHKSSSMPLGKSIIASLRNSPVESQRTTKTKMNMQAQVTDDHFSPQPRLDEYHLELPPERSKMRFDQNDVSSQWSGENKGIESKFETTIKDYQNTQKKTVLTHHFNGNVKITNRSSLPQINVPKNLFSSSNKKEDSDLQAQTLSKQLFDNSARAQNSIQRIQDFERDQHNLVISHIPQEYKFDMNIKLNQKINHSTTSRKSTNIKYLKEASVSKKRESNLSTQKDLNKEDLTSTGTLNIHSISGPRNKLISSSRNIKEALMGMEPEKKHQLLQEMKQINYTTKKIENQAVIKGSTKKIAREFNKSVDFGSHLSVKALESAKVMGHGYLYSHGKHGLIEDLRRPHANPSLSPLKQIQQIYDQKSIQMSQIGHRQVILKIDPKAPQRESKQLNHVEKSALGTATSVEVLTAIRPNDPNDEIEKPEEETLIEDPSHQTLNNVGKQIIELHVPTEQTASQFMATAKKSVTSKHLNQGVSPHETDHSQSIFQENILNSKLSGPARNISMQGSLLSTQKDVNKKASQGQKAAQGKLRSSLDVSSHKKPSKIQLEDLDENDKNLMDNLNVQQLHAQMKVSRRQQKKKDDSVQRRDHDFLFPTNPSKVKEERDQQVVQMEKVLEEAKQKSEKLTTEFYDFSEFSNLDMQIKEAKQQDFNNKLEQVQSTLLENQRFGLNSSLALTGADPTASVQTLIQEYEKASAGKQGSLSSKTSPKEMLMSHIFSPKDGINQNKLYNVDSQMKFGAQHLNEEINPIDQAEFQSNQIKGAFKIKQQDGASLKGSKVNSQNVAIQQIIEKKKKHIANLGDISGFQIVGQNADVGKYGQKNWMQWEAASSYNQIFKRNEQQGNPKIIEKKTVSSSTLNREETSQDNKKKSPFEKMILES